MRSRFQIFLFVLAASFLPQAAFAEQERAGAQTVYLTAREPEGYNPSVGFAAPLLERELIRQALLLAARDELGLATRDVLLREEFPEKPDPKSVPFRLSASANGPEGVPLTSSSARCSSNARPSISGTLPPRLD